MKLPSISVVISVKNGERFLRDCIQSVLAQTLKSSEIILIDGHSTDSTPAIARSFPQIRYILQSTLGISAAYNEGILNASGDMIAFISHDDLWTTDKLAVQVNWMIEHPQLVYTTAHVKFFMEPGILPPSGFRPELLIGDHRADIMETLVAHRRAFDLIGLFDTELAIAADVDWFAQARDAHIAAECLPQVLLHKRIHDTNSSNTDPESKELLAVMRKSIERKRGIQKN
jgi:glycosyltransferase involved in cell wall biosynthesis